jgi:hypothetical protein
VFPVRYEPHFYIAFRRNSVFKGLSSTIRWEIAYLVYKELHDIFVMIEMRSVCTDPSDWPVGINHNLFLIRN